MNGAGKEDHWLARPGSIRLLWRIFIAVLLLTVAVQFAFGTDGHFGVDGWYGFGAVYGFLSCLAMVLAAKGLGLFLKRPDDYYSGKTGDD